MTAVETTVHPFDEVVLLAPPPERRVGPAEFFALPMALRLRHVIAKTAIFLRGGEVVDPQVALAQRLATRLAS